MVSFDESDDAFCRDFAQVVGQWLGLQPVAAMTAACQQKPAPGTKPKPPPAATATPVLNKTGKPAEPRFMQLLAEAKAEDKFWDTAKFSQEDLDEILAPACPKSTPTPRKGRGQN
jgi:hypothetical protein